VLKFVPLSKKYFIFGVLLIASIIGISLYLYQSYYYPSTDDAYANADVVYISAQVPGQVRQVLVQDHQEVAQGALLFTLEAAPFTEAYNQAQAELLVAEEQLAAGRDAIQVAEATLTRDQANLTYQQKHYQRILHLVEHRFISEEEADAALENLKQAEASATRDQAALAQAKQNLNVQKAEVEAAAAKVESARINLSYTEVYAPVAGTVNGLTLRPGAVVTLGTDLFALIDTCHYWVDANFKETDLKRIHPGQSAVVVFDMYPEVKFKGQVESISGGSGAAFSLLPPENATGNWVKVTQRFPVRIKLPISALSVSYPIRVGASADVTINTKTN